MTEFRPLEVTRHTQLSDKMRICYFELSKLPRVTNADSGDELKLWLALFNAGTEEELSNIQKIGGDVMVQAVEAYRKNIINSARHILYSIYVLYIFKFISANC